MSSKIESLIENLFMEAKETPPKPVKPANDKKDRARWEAMNKARGINRPYKPTSESSEGRFASLKRAIEETFNMKVPSVPTTARDAVKKKKSPAEVQAANIAQRKQNAADNAAAQAAIKKRQAMGQRGGKKHFGESIKRVVIEAFQKPEKPDNYYDTGTKVAYQQAINKGLEKEGKNKSTIARAGGDSAEFDKIQKSKDSEKSKNMAPVHYQKDATGATTKRRDLKAGPKGHSAKNTFEKKGKRQAQADKFSKGTKSAPMSKDAINQSGVEGQVVKKDGQTIPSKRWSALKGALANRNYNKSMKKIPDGN